MGSLWMIDRLNDETHLHHAEADGDLDVLFGRETSATDYMLYLMRLHGFEAPLESALITTPTLDLMLNLRERSRASLIAMDLVALGLPPVSVADLPMCLTIPTFRGAAEALGWMYVCERATLAHGVIRHHLQTRFPIEMQKASSYLQAYAGTAGSLWRKFGTTLDNVARHPAIADRVVVAANDAFRAQRRWLQSDVLGSTARAAG